MRSSSRIRSRIALAALVSLSVVILAVLGIRALFTGGGVPPDASADAQIVVLLPLTGPTAVDWQTPLNWAIEAVNDAGGVNGRPLRARFIDTGQEDVIAAARRVADDPSVLAVIGPDSSQAVFAVAPLFIARQKIMITPSATSADLFRAFAAHAYFWRTVGSDTSQLRAMLDLAARDGARRVALVTGSGLYGQTFFDWFGFLAAESGLEATAVVRYDQASESCERPMGEALSSRPDALIAVPEDLASRGGPGADTTGRCMAEAWRSTGTGVRLLFSDAAVTPALIDALGTSSEGLEGTRPATRPAFEEAFEQRFQREVPPYAANAYDAILLIAYGLERSGGQGGAPLADAMQEVVGSRGGTPAGWNRAGVASTLRTIRSGILADIEGASGSLDFDADSFTDPVDNLYSHWRIERGAFRTVEILEDRAPDSLGGADPSPTLPNDVPAQATPEVSSRTGLWAVLIAASAGWENYRHQADVLAFYQELRKRGVPDERIILVMDPEVASSTRNPEPGVIRNEPRGPNLFEDVRVDYDIKAMTVDRIIAILDGSVTATTPIVLAATEADNVFVFIAGHGETDGVYLGAGQPILSARDSARPFGPDALRSALSAATYRRLLVAIEACKSGAFGAAFDLPRGLLLTAASSTENSRGGTYDLDKRIWVSDQFSEALWRAATTAPAPSVSEVYRRVYSTVTGSHVGAFGTAFGDTRAVTIGEFFSP